jgi:hypothetical protein
METAESEGPQALPAWRLCSASQKLMADAMRAGD